MAEHQETDWASSFFLFLPSRRKYHPSVSVPGVSPMPKEGRRGDVIHLLGARGREAACEWAMDGATVGWVGEVV